MLCFFTHYLVDFFFPWFRLFMIADSKLLFLCLSLWVLLFKGVDDILPSPVPRHHPDLMLLCFFSGSRRYFGCSQLGGGHELCSTFSSEQANLPVF